MSLFLFLGRDHSLRDQRCFVNSLWSDACVIQANVSHIRGFRLDLDPGSCIRRRMKTQATRKKSYYEFCIFSVTATAVYLYTIVASGLAYSYADPCAKQ